MKKGFTLIEVLAVIVIIGILSLLTVPKITDLVKSSKKSSSLNSAKNYIKAVNKYLVEEDLHEQKSYQTSELNNELNIEGEMPKSGQVTTSDNFDVESASLKFKNYIITYTNGDYTIN